MTNVEQKGNPYGSLIDNRNERDDLEYIGINGRMMLKWI